MTCDNLIYKINNLIKNLMEKIQTKMMKRNRFFNECPKLDANEGCFSLMVNKSMVKVTDSRSGIGRMRRKNL